MNLTAWVFRGGAEAWLREPSPSSEEPFRGGQTSSANVPQEIPLAQAEEEHPPVQKAALQLLQGEAEPLAFPLPDHGKIH